MAGAQRRPGRTAGGMRGARRVCTTMEQYVTDCNGGNQVGSDASNVQVDAMLHPSSTQPHGAAMEAYMKKVIIGYKNLMLVVVLIWHHIQLHQYQVESLYSLIFQNILFLVLLCLKFFQEVLER